MVTLSPNPAALWHVTPTDNVPGILRDGLLLDPPRRNFRTGSRIYLARTAHDARRWAGEVAREHGSPLQVALLRVDAGGCTLLHSDDTRIGVTQITSLDPVAAGRVTVVATFTAVPVPLPDGHTADRPQPPARLWSCPDCGFTYRSAAALEAHDSDCEATDAGT